MNDTRTDQEILSALDFDYQESQACEFGGIKDSRGAASVPCLPCDQVAVFRINGHCHRGKHHPVIHLCSAHADEVVKEAQNKNLSCTVERNFFRSNLITIISIESI